MARSRQPRSTSSTSTMSTVSAPSSTENNREEVNGMSELFQIQEKDAWREAGGGAQAEKGLYTQLLEAFIGTGQRYATISCTEGHFAGKKTQSVSTAIKQARDAKNAPEGAASVKVNSKGDNVFLENTSVAE